MKHRYPSSSSFLGQEEKSWRGRLYLSEHQLAVTICWPQQQHDQPLSTTQKQYVHCRGGLLPDSIIQHHRHINPGRKKVMNVVISRATPPFLVLVVDQSSHTLIIEKVPAPHQQLLTHLYIHTSHIMCLPTRLASTSTSSMTERSERDTGTSRQLQDGPNKVQNIMLACTNGTERQAPQYAERSSAKCPYRRRHIHIHTSRLQIPTYHQHAPHSSSSTTSSKASHLIITANECFRQHWQQRGLNTNTITQRTYERPVHLPQRRCMDTDLIASRSDDPHHPTQHTSRGTGGMCRGELRGG